MDGTVSRSGIAAFRLRTYVKRVEDLPAQHMARLETLNEETPLEDEVNELDDEVDELEGYMEE